MGEIEEKCQSNSGFRLKNSGDTRGGGIEKVGRNGENWVDFLHRGAYTRIGWAVPLKKRRCGEVESSCRSHKPTNRVRLPAQPPRR